MKQFCDFLKQNGISDAHALAFFLENFSKNPAMIFNMSDEEIHHLEVQMDSAIGTILECCDNYVNTTSVEPNQRAHPPKIKSPVN